MSVNHRDPVTGVLTTVAGNNVPTFPLRSFAVDASDWVANSDSTTSTDYPYILEISTTFYNNNSVPIWDLEGAGVVPTSVERDSINMILEAIFSSTGIVLYATDLPTEDLTLRVEGV